MRLPRDARDQEAERQVDRDDHDELNVAAAQSSLDDEERPLRLGQERLLVEAGVVRGVDVMRVRGGKVARGGIRWSDRPDDFRAEILGLMKTQMVKNLPQTISSRLAGLMSKVAGGRA